MNCQIFETVVNDLAREQMMEANARDEALAHRGGCEACALRLALERRLTFGLRGLVAEMKSASASPRVAENLRDAFRSQTSSVPRTRLAVRRQYWPVAAAAAVLIAFGIAVVRLEIDGPSETAIKTSNTNGGGGSAEAKAARAKSAENFFEWSRDARGEGSWGIGDGSEYHGNHFRTE
jgi:hypothetical protein